MTLPIPLAAYKALVIGQIKEQRDGQLEYVVLAEYPPGSGLMFSCSMTSQINWGNLTVLDDRGLVTYPFTVTTYDEQDTYSLVSAADLTGAVGTVSAAVMAARDIAQSYIVAVNAAATQADVDAAAAPYLDA